MRALSALGLDNRPVGLAVLSSGLYSVTGGETLSPEKAPVLGPCRVIPNEYLNIQSRNIDIDTPKAGVPLHPALLDAIIRDVTALRDVLEGEVDAAGFAGTVVYRGRRRWEQRFAHVPLPSAPVAEKAAIRRGGVYMITGGFGGVAFELSRYLLEGWGARLVLIGRTPLPPREEWDAWLSDHPGDDAVSERIVKRVSVLRRTGVLAVAPPSTQVLPAGGGSPALLRHQGRQRGGAGLRGFARVAPPHRQPRRQ